MCRESGIDYLLVASMGSESPMPPLRVSLQLSLRVSLRVTERHLGPVELEVPLVVEQK